MLTTGVIRARAGIDVEVEVDGVVLPMMQLARHLHAAEQAAAGDACLVGVTPHGARMVIAVLGTAPAPPPPPPPEPETTETTGGTTTIVDTKPPPVVVKDSSPVGPVATGTYRGGWRSDTRDLYQGDWTGRGVNVGVAYYGGRLRQWDKLLGLTVLLRRKSGGVFGSQTPTMALLAGDSRPGGAPVIITTAPGPSLAVGASAGWAVPGSWLSRIQSGEAGGIGITSGGSRSPYIALDAAAGGMTATVNWETTT